MKVSRNLFLVFLFLYLLFPGDHQFREIGIGPEGFRLLLPDVFMILIGMAAFSLYKQATKSIMENVGRLSLFFFVGCVLFSLFCGIPQYGGWALGEARWFLSVAMIPVGFLIYDSTLLATVKKIFIITAIYHGLVILMNYFSGNAWDTVGDVERFGGGRESLIIGIAMIFLSRELILGEVRKRFKILPMIAIAFLVACLLIGQTRTIFLMLPLCILVLSLVAGRLKLIKILRFALISILTGIVFWLSFSFMVSENTTTSLKASFGVVGEAFNTDIYKMILDPTLARDRENWDVFSSSGNTLFRVLAWSQTIANINDYPGGWLVGMPLGAGFEWYGPGGDLLENMQPHNDYLVIVSKIGLIGLLAYLAIIQRYFRKVIMLRRMSSARFLFQSDVFLITTILVMILLFVFLNAEIRTYGSHFWVWIFLGIGFSSIDQLATRPTVAVEKLSR